VKAIYQEDWIGRRRSRIAAATPQQDEETSKEVLIHHIVVIPAKAGIQCLGRNLLKRKSLGSGYRFAIPE
jgi:hypothetical protein